MRIGTTPTHIFRVPINTEQIKRVRIIYKQNDELVLEKTEAQCLLGDNIVQVTLTQEDTFLFNEEYDVKIQIRLLLNDNTALSSEIIHTTCDECFSDEVLE